MLKKILNYLQTRLFYLILFVFAILTVLISPQISTPYAIVSTYLFYYLIYAQAEKIFSGLILFIIVSLSLYYPIYLHYGEPNSGIIAAFFETNPDEAWEFIRVFKLTDFQLPLIFCLFGYLVLRLKKYQQKGTDNKRILHIALWGVLVLSTVWLPIKFLSEKNSELIVEELHSTLLAKSPVNLFSFYANIYDSTINYFHEKMALDNATKQPSPWKVTSSTPKYQNYVLVIGESARLDHHSSYGFALPTSPFLARTNGYLNSGYIASAPGTYYSLLYSLYFKDKASKKINYAYHIINLAKSAGFHTVWLSNQGSMGTYDTIASRIGMAADVAEFTKKYNFRMGNMSDTKLIDLLQAQLAKPTDKPTLFVLHLMGSHQKFCERVDDRPAFNYINKELSCYATSILKTDQLLEKVVEQLVAKQQPYSLIYFSDHGLAYSNKNAKNINEITLSYDKEAKESYRVPFVKISSDDTQRVVVNTPRSAMYFIEGFAQWLGIQSKELNPQNDFFSAKPDDSIKVFNLNSLVDFDSLQDDPLIEIKETEKK